MSTQFRQQDKIESFVYRRWTSNIISPPLPSSSYSRPTQSSLTLLYPSVPKPKHPPLVSPRCKTVLRSQQLSLQLQHPVPKNLSIRCSSPRHPSQLLNQPFRRPGLLPFP